MSQLAAPTRAPRRMATSRPRGTAARPAVRAARPVTKVAAVKRTGHSRFMALVIIVALASALALLFLNTMRAEQSFTLSTLRSDVATLDDRSQALESEISAVSAPEELTMKAEGFGMVKASSVTFVDRATGKKIGMARPSATGGSLAVNTLPNTPSSKAAGEVLASGTVGLHITDPVAREKADAVAKADAAAKKAADEAKKAAASTKDAGAAKTAAADEAKKSK